MIYCSPLIARHFSDLEAMQYVGIGCCDSELDLQLIPLQDIDRDQCEILCATSKNCKGYSYGNRLYEGKTTTGCFRFPSCKKTTQKGVCEVYAWQSFESWAKGKGTLDNGNDMSNTM